MTYDDDKYRQIPCGSLNIGKIRRMPLATRGYLWEMVRYAERPDGLLSLTGEIAEIAGRVFAHADEMQLLESAIDTLLGAGYLTFRGDAIYVTFFREWNPVREYIPVRVRREVIDRDRHVCGICGDPIAGRFHIDHIVPCILGGQSVLENLQMAHPFCNLSKGGRA